MHGTHFSSTSAILARQRKKLTHWLCHMESSVADNPIENGQTRDSQGESGRSGKQNGKKFTGILLCLFTAISSAKGRNLLEKQPKWRECGVIKDWIVMLETSLEWEAWPNGDKMMKSDVHKAKTKHRHIVHLMRKVAARTSRMGLKLMKFHGILHMADVILNFGVPLEHDTGVNKSHHVPTKKASLLTQRDVNKIEEQTAERMLEMEVLALVKLKIERQ